MANDDAASKYYEALNETSDAVIDAIRAANNRGHRFTTALIEQAQENQRDAAEITRKWAAAPFDMIGLMSSITESTTKAQGRALDATRQIFNEFSDVQKETRDIVQRVIAANRSANEASVNMARSAFSRATTAVQTATERTNGKPADTKANSPKTEAKVR
ncbi:MAG: hypothetical protein IIB22_04825 [Chloroflexi bacterium]|nr:hypothetical protein [Chloroflexota bacterium]